MFSNGPLPGKRTRIVEQHVYPAEAFNGPTEQSRYRYAIGNVGSYNQGSFGIATALLDDGTQCRVSAARQNYTVASSEQCEGHGAPNSRPGSGYDGNRFLRGCGRGLARGYHQVTLSLAPSLV